MDQIGEGASTVLAPQTIELKHLEASDSTVEARRNSHARFVEHQVFDLAALGRAKLLGSVTY